ncbi:hypothetical protein [Methanococcoides burtonii]|uniref:hypothetical protein n=1 Tax=Methanococcoides burtonii TaxID=29291 RepID=UPI000045E190|nr:hypothetical protein [Methanococcoides burtonii]
MALNLKTALDTDRDEFSHWMTGPVMCQTSTISGNSSRFTIFTHLSIPRVPGNNTSADALDINADRIRRLI